MIQDSKATIANTKSYRLYLDIHYSTVEPKSWLYYHSSVHTGVNTLAEHYINNHASIKSSNDIIFTSDPAAVFRFEREGHKVQGLYYGNGAVAVTDDDLIELWIDSDTVRLFSYPLPSTLTSQLS